MYFLNDDDDVLEKYNIWDKVSADIKKKYDNEPIYKKNYKKKNHDEVTDFYDKERWILIILV